MLLAHKRLEYSCDLLNLSKIHKLMIYSCILNYLLFYSKMIKVCPERLDILNVCQLTSPLLIIYIAVTPCMLYFELLFCSRPRALVARVYYVKSLPTSSGQGDELHALYIPLGI